MAFDLEMKYIEELENELNISFPEVYREFMRESNGGEFELADDEWWLYPIRDAKDRKRIARTANHLLKENNFLKENSGFPTDAIAIAYSSEGNQIVCRIEEEKNVKEQLYFWSHESQELEALELNFSDLGIY